MKPAPAFDLPEDAEAEDLTEARLNNASIEPTTHVYVFNRGRRVLENMTFDGRHRDLPVGLFVTEYGAAKHFQERAVVPGTRNVAVGGHVSWLGILGTVDRRIAVDPPEMCVPFTDEELGHFGESLEAIDRSAMTGVDRYVVPVRTQAARAMSRSQGTGGMRAPFGNYVDASTQVSDAAAEAAEHVLDPTNEPLQTREAEFEAGRRQGDPAPYEAPTPPPVDSALPQPRAMRMSRRK